MDLMQMAIIQTYYIYKCLECGNKILLKDITKDEFYCCNCGLIHDLEMLDAAKQNYYKDRLAEIKKNNPTVYKLIQRDIKQEKLNKLKIKGGVNHARFKRNYFNKICKTHKKIYS